MVAAANALTVRSANEVQIREFELGLLSFISATGLPTEGVLVPISERSVLLGNAEHALRELQPEQRRRSTYLSKFLAAAACGLFDAALNYLWDETIVEVRARVTQYDLAYFFDVAVTSPEKRSRLRTEEDLRKLDDSDLVRGAHGIGLISDLGYKHLDYIRYMRNWASAAHPNQNEISGLQLVSWLETCLREVVNLPLSNIVVEIGRLLANVKSTAIAQTDANQTAAFFANLSQDRVDALGSGFFGIYASDDTTPQTRQNINLLLPLLWERVSEDSRRQFGVRYGRFVANGEQQKKTHARAFLELVSGAPYIPDGLRSAELDAAVDNLLTAHRGFNNFYNEPSFAYALARLIGSQGRIPVAVQHKYVLAIVEVFLTNGHGVCFSADVVYRKLIGRFDGAQATTALLSFNQHGIRSRLQFSLCKAQFLELLELLTPTLSGPAFVELIAELRDFPGSFDGLSSESSIKRKAANLGKILDS